MLEPSIVEKSTESTYKEDIFPVEAVRLDPIMVEKKPSFTPRWVTWMVDPFISKEEMVLAVTSFILRSFVHACAPFTPIVNAWSFVT